MFYMDNPSKYELLVETFDSAIDCGSSALILSCLVINPLFGLSVMQQ